MGSFYATCSISHMTLTYQPTSILLLLPSTGEEKYPRFCREDLITSNEGPLCFWVPFGFPIKGSYYDYGYIHNIEKNHNTKLLEDFFNLDIEDILFPGNKNENYTQGLDGAGIKNYDIFRNLTKTYIRTEILEYLEKGWEKLYDENPNKYTLEKSIQELLVALDTPYFENLDIDENWGSPETYKEKDPKKRMYIYERIMSPRNHVHGFISPYLGRYNMYRTLDIKPDIFKDDILKQARFIRSMLEMNRILLQSLNGGQENNYETLMNFNQKVNQVLKKEIKNNCFQ